MTLVWVFATYGAILGLAALINRRDLSDSPEKRARYTALPLLYKLACWFGVIPLFVAVVFVHEAFFLAGGLAMVLVQRACVGWYQRNGHLPTAAEP